MTHIDRVGDRFERDTAIIEIIEVNEFYTYWESIYDPDDLFDHYPNKTQKSPKDEGWERFGFKYLGNFNKSKDFNSLYEKLNGGVQEG